MQHAQEMERMDMARFLVQDAAIQGFSLRQTAWRMVLSRLGQTLSKRGHVTTDPRHLHIEQSRTRSAART
jgi:hypothetical protein